MFNHSYFAAGYFSPDYWPPIVDVEEEKLEIVGQYRAHVVNRRPSKAKRNIAKGQLTAKQGSALSESESATQKAAEQAQERIASQLLTEMATIGSISKSQQAQLQKDARESLRATLKAYQARREAEYDDRLRLLMLMG